MRNEGLEAFRFYSEERNRQYLAQGLPEGMSSLTERLTKAEIERWQRIAEDFKARNIQILHTDSKINITKVVEEHPYFTLFYKVHITWHLKQSYQMYEQSWVEYRRCILKEEQGWLIVEDELFETEGIGFLNHPVKIDKGYEIRNPNERRGIYNRQKAVEYAERWWNDYNPKFKHFEVDCTNYVSQCLYAGGAPMMYSSDRAKGWWYRFEEPNWSFSWTVANALRWYLPTSKSGLRAKEVSSADQLHPGDVICYDFDGDGRWQHNTIVVAKDAVGMPLVNAHTTNSKHRFWDYRDSYAWTEKTAYKFFRIHGQF